MYKTLFLRYLLSSFALLAFCPLSAQESLKNRPDRTIDFHQQVQEQLYSTALSQMATHKINPSQLNVQKDQLVSLLNTRYPELVYELENTPEQIISQQEVTKLLLTIINEESSFGNLDLEGSLWESAKSNIEDSEGIATLEFLYGYELFKQKRLKEAHKNFQRLAKMRKGPYEYALYYGGLTSLLDKKFTEAIHQLKAIGKVDALKSHIPYYLSASHYGNRDYTSVIKYYENRIQDRALFNVEGITQIVAYSNYHLQRYDATINNLNILSQYRNLSENEKYVLGKALLNTGQNEEGNNLLSEIADQSQESQLKQTASYEYALNLSKEGKYEEAKSMFTSMLSDDQYPKEDLQYNIAILDAKTGNYNKATENALTLIKGKYQKQVLSLLSDMIEYIENPSTYISVIDAIDIRTKDKSVIKSSLYKKAITALQTGNFSKANSYFEKLKTIDPLIEERGAVAAWKGIMAYQDGDFKAAQKMLTNYLNSKSTQSAETTLNRELDFNAHYFLAYSSFKLKDHKNALGHFSKSLEVVMNPSDIKMEEDIQLRIGDSYFLMDQYDLAKTSYDVAESLNQSHRPYALWQKAVIAELQNESYDQLLILDDIIGTHPQSKYFGRAIFSAANTLFSLNKYDKSATLYKRLEKEDVPNRMKEEAIVQLGLISVNAGAYDVAETYYNRIIQSSKDKELQHRAHLALKEIYADYTYDTDAYLSLINKEENNDQSEIADEIIFGLATRNFEAANYSEAISQWNKLINEYPESDKGQEAQFQIGISYQKQEEMTNAMDAYRATTQFGASEWSSKAYDQMEGIAFTKNKDHELYLQLLQDRKQTFPSYKLSTIQTYQAVQCAVAVEDLEAIKIYVTSIFELNDIALKDKTTILSDANALFMKHKKWDYVTELASSPILKKIIDTTPKYIYTRSLAFMNQSKLDTAAELITASYSELLSDPAWLAKSIILLADIYTLKGDKDSAIAALQALIETKSEVPSSLIDMAKNRLDLITPQN